MKRFIALSIAAAIASTAAAQTFNIDFGNFNPVPSSSFGAASGQTGTWNQVNGGAVNAPLLTTSGAASGVTTSNNGFNFSFNNAQTSGDFENLMDDLLDSPTSVTVNGLAAGTYQVYTYAWAPDSATFFTNVSVNGSAPTQVGGALAGPNTFSAGITHAVNSVTIAAGQALTINVTSTSFESVNGIQIVPEPATLSLLGLGALALIRRR